MSCFNNGCNRRHCWNSCRDNDWNNNCNRCEREKREAYWAGFKDGCRNPRCRWRNNNGFDNRNGIETANEEAYGYENSYENEYQNEDAYQNENEYENQYEYENENAYDNAYENDEEDCGCE